MAAEALAADKFASSPCTGSARQALVWRHAERMAPSRERWIRRAAFFHAEDLRYLRFLVPENSRVLELGCGTGHLLAALKPSFGVGVDFSQAMIEVARKRHPSPNLMFVTGDVEDPALIRSLRGPFDIILIVDTLGSIEDCQAMLESLHSLCNRTTRLVVVHFSHLWHPLLKLAEALHLRMPQLPQNVLSPQDVAAVVTLADFEPVKSERRLLCPIRALGLGRLINRFIAPLPIVGGLSLRHYSVFRSCCRPEPIRSVSVIVPARNERGNIEQAVRRIPRFADDLEIIFVEGHSRDGTWEEIQRVAAKYRHHDVKALQQPGKGKADAVFAGFDAARGDVLMILDGDLTMPPEQLPKFWQVLRSGRGEFVNGSRLVYPMEEGAMRYLNLIANRAFSILFTWLLGERLTDTLCGTKALRRSDYLRLKRDRGYFGDFDPWRF